MRSFLVLGVKRLRTGDRGFGMVETVMAMGILFLALMVLAFGALVGFRDAGVARQRQAANAIVNKLMEQVRSLPYVTISKGMADADLTGDADIVRCGNKYNYLSCSGEEIVHTTGLPTTAPLVPHQGTYGTSQGYPTTYNWAVYVTNAADAPSSGGYRVRVRVSWSSPERASSTAVATDSLVFQPQGTTDSDSHVAGSTGAFFFGAGSITRGNIVITPNTSVGNPTGISGVPAWNSIRIDMPALDSSVQQEQLANISTSSSDIGGKHDYGGSVRTYGERIVVNEADDDSTTSIPTYTTSSYGDLDTQSAQNCSSPSSPWNCISLGLSGGSSSGSATSTTSAGGPNTCNGQTDSRPCSYARQSQGYDQSIYLDLGGATPQNVLSNGALVTIRRPTVAETAYGRRLVVSGDGIVRQTVTRALAGSVGIGIGDLPLQSNDKPRGWNNAWIYIQTAGTNWNPVAQVEAGQNASSPSISWPASPLQISVWNGSGYGNITFPTTGNPTAGGTICQSGCTWPITPLNYCWRATPTLSYLFTISGSFTVGTSYTERSPSTGTTINDAKAVIGSPLAGTFDYVVYKHSGGSTCNTGNPGELANLHFTVDLGRVVTHAVYKPAP